MNIEDVTKIVKKSVHYHYASVIMNGMRSYSFPLKDGSLNIEENQLCFIKDDEFRPHTCIFIDEIKKINLRELVGGRLDDWYQF